MRRSRIVLSLIAVAALALMFPVPAGAAGAIYDHDIGFFGTAEVTPVDAQRDAGGNWYLLDENLNCIRVYAPDLVTVVDTLFTCGEKANDLTHLNDPRGLGIDVAAGRLWIADGIARVLRVDLATDTVSSSTIPEAGKISIYDVAVDESGNAYLSDGGGRIIKLSPSGAFLTMWGSQGSGNGQLKNPQQIAYSPAGTPAVYVLDQGNFRVAKFGTSGAWLGSFGTRGSGDGQFRDFSRGVAVDAAGTVYSGDGGGNRVLRWTSSGTALTSLGSGLPYYRSGPLDLFYGARGLQVVGDMLAVCDMWNFRMQLWTLNGSYIGQIGGAPPPLGGHAWPRGVALDAAGNVYVTDRWHEWVQKFAPDGTFLARFGIGRGQALGTLNFPGGLDIDDTGGFIYIANRESQAVDRWRLSDGAISTRFRPPGGKIGKPWPKDVAVNETTGKMYVADSRNDQVAVIAQDGSSTIISKWDVSNRAMGHAESVALDEAGGIYIADSSLKRVHVYNASGVWVRSFIVAEAPSGIEVRNGVVYLIGKTVYQYTTTGTLITNWGSVGTGNNQLRGVYVGIAVDPSGNVYIADTSNHRVKVFTPA